MTAEQVTSVVLLTPEGRGAVASLMVAGPSAISAVGALFHAGSGGPLAEQPINRILYGRWLSAETGEDVIVCRRSEQQVEIHCHGGAAAARAIIESLVECGCRAIDWSEWTRRSADDPIAAEARILLARAPTRRTAAILWDQQNGALRRAIDAIIARLDVGDTQNAMQRLEELLGWARLGRHLVDPWRVVLAGPPNVGKSSLINALLGYQRAIVHDTAGTTRDVVSAATALDGWPVELSDTAGLHRGNAPLERAGIQLARQRLTDCDLVVLVFDAARPRSPDDEALASEWPNAVHVCNKCDLLGPQDRADFPPSCCLTSATRGDGIAELQSAVTRRLVPVSPEPGQAMPFLPEQVAVLEQVRELITAGRVEAAKEVLGRKQFWSPSTC